MFEDHHQRKYLGPRVQNREETAWWHTSLTPSLGRQRQAKCEASQGYIVRVSKKGIKKIKEILFVFMYYFYIHIFI